MVSKHRKLSISQRLTLQYSVILFCILISFSMLIFFYIRHNTAETVRKEVKSSADIVLDYLHNIQSLDELSQSNVVLSQSTAYSIFDKDNKLIYSSRPDLAYMNTLSESSSILQKIGTARRNSQIIFAHRDLHIMESLYHVQVADVMDSAGALPRVLLITSIFGIVVCFVSGTFLTKKLLHPIKYISMTAKEITSQNLDKRIHIAGPDDELKELADIINSMVERLEEDFEKQRRFVSDTSHELRTPLSVIHGYINMLDRWGKSDSQVLDESLASLKTEVDNMKNLIENLLYLAKVDNCTIVMNPQPFPVSILLKEVCDETMLVNGQIKFSYDCKDYLAITADYNALKQVLRILLDNSIKFSDPSKKIWIIADEAQNGVSITVADQGTGIPSESLPYIFDRFYRVDSSRNKNTGGAGLGLSIAKQIVKSHKGTICAQSEPGQGTKITLHIPQCSGEQN